MKHLIGSLSLKRDENQIERERKMTGVYIYICYIIIYKCVNPYRVIRHTHTM